MLIIKHRVNDISSLLLCDKSFGVEIDIRSKNGELILAHEPYVNGELFNKWLDYYNHSFIVLNIKEEGLEDRILESMESKGITNFFFLDNTFPFLLKTAMKGENRIAGRYSAFESVNTILNINKLIKWVWVDTFTHFSLNHTDYKLIKNAGLKICIVSPELIDFNRKNEIFEIKNKIESSRFKIDAVCTKLPKYWHE